MVFQSSYAKGYFSDVCIEKAKGLNYISSDVSQLLDKLYIETFKFYRYNCLMVLSPTLPDGTGRPRSKTAAEKMQYTRISAYAHDSNKIPMDEPCFSSQACCLEVMSIPSDVWMS